MFKQAENTLIILQQDDDHIVVAHIVERTSVGTLNTVRIRAHASDDMCDASMVSMGQMSSIRGRRCCQELVQWLLPLRTNLVNWLAEDEQKIERLYKVLKI